MPPPDTASSAGEQTIGPAQPADVPDLSTLGDPISDKTPHASADPTRATGRYHVLRPHAHGGLGEVFVAHDDELGRDVALKRLNPVCADDPDSRRRFVAEAAVTARLEHPGVVPVHGLVQDANGRPAYAMRFIRGETLESAIRKFHNPASADSGKKSTSEIIIGALKWPPVPRFDSLEFRQLLSRFVAVCNAIAFAHSRGIIHRDLKPANVMLGPFGETLVVDWGLAKDTASGGREAVGPPPASSANSSPDSSADSPSIAKTWVMSPRLSGDSETEAGVILGTPAFMAPEQAAGQVVGSAADVYGLGAILYNMLTGSVPIRGKDSCEVLERARRGEVPPPRVVIPAVPRPLAAVCGKAMAFAPASRYESALILAADIERWLADEPVSVEVPPLRERIGRWGRRHRTAVASSIALLATAVVGLAVATTLISRQEAATAAAKTRAEEQRDRADQNLKLAARAIDAAKTRVSGNPRLMAGDFHDLRVELLSALIPFYEELAKQSGDDPAVQAQRGEAFGFLANLRRETGQADQAERDFLAYVDVFSQLAERDPTDLAIRRRLADGHNDLGNMLGDLHKWDRARAELGEAVRLDRELVAAEPGNPIARRSLATGLNGLAVAVENGKTPAAAEAMYREALDLARGLATDDASDRALIGLCAAIENNLATFLRRARRPADAEPLLRSAIDRRNGLAQSDAADRRNRAELVAARFNLALLLHTTGRLPEAEAEYRADIGIAEKLATDFAGVPIYRQLLGKPLVNLGDLLGSCGRSQEAAEIGGRAAALFDRLTADFPGNPDYYRAGGDSWYNVGNALQNLNRTADAEASYRRAADDYAKQATAAPTDPKPVADLAFTWVMLGRLAQSNGKPAVALEWFDKAIARLGGARGDGALQEAHAGRAGALVALGKYTDSVTAWNASIAASEPAGRPSLRLQRARTLILAGDFRRAAGEAKDLTAPANASADILDGSARVLALAAAKADRANANDYAVDAVALLGRAHTAGMYREPGSADKLRGDANLAPLRERDDFRRFLAEVGK